MPARAKLADLLEAGVGLEELCLFKSEHADQIKAEANARRSKGKNDKRDRERRASPIQAAEDEGIEPVQEEGVLQPPVGASMFASLLFKTIAPRPLPVKEAKAASITSDNPVKQTKRPTAKEVAEKEERASRATGGPPLKSAELKSLRIRTWFHALLAVANPVVALHYELVHRDTSERQQLSQTRLSQIFKQLLEASAEVIVPTTLSDPNVIVEDYVENHLRPGIQISPLNLFKRDYLNGANQPTKHTVELFETVFPGSSTVYIAGPHGIPVWEILDGKESVLNDFLLESCASLVVPSSAEGWSQAILNLVLEPEFAFAMKSLYANKDFYRFNIDFDDAVRKSIRARFERMGEQAFQDEAENYAKAAFLALAAHLSMGTNKLTPTQQFKWLINGFYRLGFYRKFFGFYLDDYIATNFTKGLPVSKL